MFEVTLSALIDGCLEMCEGAAQSVPSLACPKLDVLVLAIIFRLAKLEDVDKSAMSLFWPKLEDVLAIIALRFKDAGKSATLR